MKKQIVLLALGAAALGCSSDSTSPASANPDAAVCNKGSINVGDTKTGSLTASSCVRYDFAYSDDSTPFDNYSFKAEKGKGYMFELESADHTTNWDALLELATVNPTTGEEQLLDISDDEGGHGFSRMYFIAPVSGTVYLRAGSYDKGVFADYALTARSCDSPIPQVTDTLAPSTQTLSASDCVLSQPNFINDSAHVKLFSLQIGPNETKTVTVTSTDFPPGLQIYGPAWGVSCDYSYQGCGGGYAAVQKSNTAQYTITAEGDESCNDAFHAPDHVGPLASLHSSQINICEFYNWPGQYTVAVGSFFSATGSFTFAVSDGEPPPTRIVGADQQTKNPTLNFLRKKPIRGSQYLSRSMSARARTKHKAGAAITSPHPLCFAATLLSPCRPRPSPRARRPLPRCSRGSSARSCRC